jgi:hypothetical protein
MQEWNLASQRLRNHSLIIIIVLMSTRFCRPVASGSEIHLETSRKRGLGHAESDLRTAGRGRAARKLKTTAPIRTHFNLVESFK